MNTSSSLKTTSEPMDSWLQAASHWRVEPPFAMDAADLHAQIDIAARLIGAQIAHTSRCADFAAEELVVVSTVMTAAITMEGEGQTCFLDGIENACGLRPQGILNAYMCTGWGYALRHFMRHTGVTRLAIAIVDLDVHNLAWQRKHPVIGPSGFGVTTLLFTLPEDREQTPQCSGPHPNSAFNDFMMALKARQARHGGQPTFIPFTLDALASTAQRVLIKGSLGPNRNAEYGHCFGADPWIGLIEWFGATRPSETCTVVAGAIAYNGYYTFAAVGVHPRTHVEFQRVEGHVDALEQFIAAHSRHSSVAKRSDSEGSRSPAFTGEEK